jgi:hypothetical protein
MALPRLKLAEITLRTAARFVQVVAATVSRWTAAARRARRPALAAMDGRGRHCRGMKLVILAMSGPQGM